MPPIAREFRDRLSEFAHGVLLVSVEPNVQRLEWLLQCSISAYGVFLGKRHLAICHSRPHVALISGA